MEVLFLLGLSLILFSFVLSVTRLLNCLIIIENINVLLLLTSLLGQAGESRVLFLTLMVVFTIEVTLALVVLTRLWDYSSLIDIVGV
uniref:NADH dehydrogenase subunit 4L n=1 Tax=Azygia robusta TaxID=3062496 RepID=A0AA50ZMS1_9TREM|nr:NADH dehydrogenase subunit 4L [Azygia robusta]WMH04197.1 NADH dehydrogenase subunit 4L [Azygia robusta]WMH04209.1 NADH dehydrogenase subunit 4L [Azygia robusta]